MTAQGLCDCEVDETACIFGWGPCIESFGFSHSCRKEQGHDGFHICALCGNRKKETP